MINVIDVLMTRARLTHLGAGDVKAVIEVHLGPAVVICVEKLVENRFLELRLAAQVVIAQHYLHTTRLDVNHLFGLSGRTPSSRL